MRAFVAVEVPTVEVDGHPTGSTAQPSHVTLQFLGELADSNVGGVSAALAEVASQSSTFPVELSGVGLFPSPARPRVAWVGVGEGSDQMVALAGTVGRALLPLGFAGEKRPFVPHVTLFRIRSPEDARRARELVSRRFERPFARGVVSELRLVESSMEPAGVVHRAVALFPLRGPPS
jgi:2'-5' RNA ligase